VAEQEGVVKFQYAVRRRVAVDEPFLRELGSIRGVLRRLGLLGQDAERYDGYGFGNVSHRLPDGGFVVSGSQTGHLTTLSPAEWVRVLSADLEGNSLVAEGLAPPSSESLTHAAIYAADPLAQCVLHLHCPEIFHAAGRLGLPTTPVEVPYGTPAMARAIGAAVAAAGPGATAVAVMAGHEDGILVWSPLAIEACVHAVRTLIAAEP
jgi:hypothetical protein